MLVGALDYGGWAWKFCIVLLFRKSIGGWKGGRVKTRKILLPKRKKRTRVKPYFFSSSSYSYI